MRQLSAEGIGIVLTSDTLEETIGSATDHRDARRRDPASLRRPPGHKPAPVDLVEEMV